MVPLGFPAENARFVLGNAAPRHLNRDPNRSPPAPRRSVPDRLLEDEEVDLRDGEVAIALPARFDAGLHYIGVIHTPWKRRTDCPKNGRESTAVCTIEVAKPYEAALAGIESFSHLVVVYFMDRARRDLVIQMPRHLAIPRGTFALRSPVRPNPIALSVVRLVKVEGRTLSVVGIDCIDGTPLLDLKPYLPTVDVANPEKHS
jgi:tRNA-Thr(GGU) m(6)t(6)A37 methyltransferase TsaA